MGTLGTSSTVCSLCGELLHERCHELGNSRKVGRNGLSGRSARASRFWFWRLAKTNLPSAFCRTTEEKFATAGSLAGARGPCAPSEKSTSFKPSKVHDTLKDATAPRLLPAFRKRFAPSPRSEIPVTERRRLACQPPPCALSSIR